MPSSSATLLAGALAVMLARRGQARARPAVLIGAWAALLAAAFAVAVLGLTGVTANLLMLARIRRTTEIQRATPPGGSSNPGSPTATSRRPHS